MGFLLELWQLGGDRKIPLAMVKKVGGIRYYFRVSDFWIGLVEITVVEGSGGLASRIPS